jgi:hypothetical protein
MIDSENPSIASCVMCRKAMHEHSISEIVECMLALPVERKS